MILGVHAWAHGIGLSAGGGSFFWSGGAQNATEHPDRFFDCVLAGDGYASAPHYTRPQ